MEFPKHEFVAVLWEDVHATGPTTVVTAENIDAHHKAVPILTTGWVLRDDEKGITVANEYIGDGEFRGVTIVLRPLVLEVFKMKGPRRPRKRKLAVPAVGAD